MTSAQGIINSLQSTSASINSQISQANEELNTIQATSAQNSTTKAVPNGNIDTNESLLENVARNNLWSSNDLSKNNDNIIPQNIYVSPDSNKDQANPNADVAPDFSAAEYAPYFELDSIDADNGMTESQKEEMNIFLLNMLNHAREDRGLQPFISTKDKFDQAQVRASQTSASELDHDTGDIKKSL